MSKVYINKRTKKILIVTGVYGDQVEVKYVESGSRGWLRMKTFKNLYLRITS